MLRFRVRTLMIAAGVVAIALATVGPARRCYRCWSHYRSEAAFYANLEAKALSDRAMEVRAADPDVIRRRLMNFPEFANRSAEERERIVDRSAEKHRLLAVQFLTEAHHWAKSRRDSELESYWACIPFASDYPEWGDPEIDIGARPR